MCSLWTLSADGLKLLISTLMALWCFHECVHIQDEAKITREAESKDKLGNKHNRAGYHILPWRELEMKKHVSVFFLSCVWLMSGEVRPVLPCQHSGHKDRGKQRHIKSCWQQSFSKQYNMCKQCYHSLSGAQQHEHIFFTANGRILRRTSLQR